MTLFLNFVVLGVCLAAITAAAPTARVVFVIGQSNARGQNSDGLTPEDVTYPNLLQTSCCVNYTEDNTQCKLVSGQDPLHHKCDKTYLNGKTIGFAMSFARELHAQVAEDDVIVLVPAAIGGTGFVDHVWTAYNGTGFVNAQERIQATFKLLAQNYPQHTAVLEVILWHQGESDAGVNTSTLDYLNLDIIPMIQAWRDRKVIAESSQETPFIVGNLSPSWIAENTNRLGVSTSLQLLNQLVPYTGVAPSQGLVGDVHFTAKSQRILGRRYFQAWKAAKLNNQLSGL